MGYKPKELSGKAWVGVVRWRGGVAYSWRSD